MTKHIVVVQDPILSPMFGYFLLNGTLKMHYNFNIKQKALFVLRDKVVVHHTQAIEKSDQYGLLLRFCDL